jgi:hypothetical protein
VTLSFGLCGDTGEFDDWADPVHRLLVEARAGERFDLSIR